MQQQGHHHNGDQAARRPHMLCSICGRWFTTPLFGGTWGLEWTHLVARPYIPISSSLTHNGLSVTVFELFSWLQKCFHPSVRPGYDDKYRSRSYRFVKRQKSRPVQRTMVQGLDTITDDSSSEKRQHTTLLELRSAWLVTLARWFLTG